MRKLLGIALLTLVMLVGCGGNDNGGTTDYGNSETDYESEVADSGATVCLMEVMGEETRMIIYEENGYVTSFTSQSLLDVSEMSQEDIDMAVAVAQETLGDIFHIEHVGNYIITSMTIAGEYLEGDPTLAEAIAELEGTGATCN